MVPWPGRPNTRGAETQVDHQGLLKTGYGFTKTNKKPTKLGFHWAFTPRKPTKIKQTRNFNPLFKVALEGLPVCWSSFLQGFFGVLIGCEYSI